MKLLQEIINTCKASVTITSNSHKDYYQDIKDYLKEQYECRENEEEAQDSHHQGGWHEVKQKIIEKDVIIEAIVFPHTPVGSYAVAHYDLTELLEIVARLIDIEIK